MVELLELLKWLIHEYGPAIIPSLIALFLAYRVARERTSTLFDDYHEAIVAQTKEMARLATLASILEERTRELDTRSLSQDRRTLRQDVRAKRIDEAEERLKAEAAANGQGETE